MRTVQHLHDVDRYMYFVWKQRRLVFGCIHSVYTSATFDSASYWLSSKYRSVYLE